MLRNCFMAALCIAAGGHASFGQPVAANCKLRGSVVHEKGAPVAGLFLTAYSSMIAKGRWTMAIAGLATTDDAGQYCMRQLTGSGLVFLLTNEWFDFKQPQALHRKLPSTWYPGVADFRSPDRLTVGPDSRADFRLRTVSSFTIEGKTTELTAFGRIDLYAESPDGIAVQNGVLDIDPQQARFTIEGVTSGHWTFVVTASDGGERLYASLYYAVDRDIHDAVLAFAAEPHLHLNVNGKPFRDSDQSAKEGFGLFLCRPADCSPHLFSFGVSSVPPGAYKLLVLAGFDCIESFSPGDVPPPVARS